MTRGFFSTGGRRALRAIIVAGLGCAMNVQISRAADLPSSSSIPTASTVGPAPIIDQPLPPAVSQEVPEPQPTPRHVWVAGHWRWQEGSYVWIAPHWELPPVANSAWVPPRWEKQGNGYVLIGGYWDQ